MATYTEAAFGNIEISNKKLYIASDQIKWNHSIKRERFYIYDNNIEDYDYLMTTVNLENLFDVRKMKYVIEAKYGNRPDILAFEFYGDVDYWWLILMLNNIESFEDFTTGREIYIPDISAFKSNISNANYEIQKSSS